MVSTLAPRNSPIEPPMSPTTERVALPRMSQCRYAWGTEDAEIKVLSVENPGMNYVLLLKAGVVQNIAMHALPTNMNFFLVLTSTFPIQSPSSPPPPPILSLPFH